MGSKKLKAIVVDGTRGEVTVAHPDEFREVVMEASGISITARRRLTSA